MNDKFQQFKETLQKILLSESVEERNQSFSYSVDMRYVGQSDFLTLPITFPIDERQLEKVTKRFHVLHNQNYFWFVVLDNASAHTTPAVMSFAEQHRDRLELVYLPTYRPHLNLIERLWRLMRSQITRNRFFESLNDVSWLGPSCTITSADC